MKTFFDCMDYATNAACPQRPAWQITPVGYKWAQSVFQKLNPHCVRPTNDNLNVTVLNRDVTSWLRKLVMAN